MLGGFSGYAVLLVIEAPKMNVNVTSFTIDVWGIKRSLTNH